MTSGIVQELYVEYRELFAWIITVSLIITQSLTFLRRDHQTLHPTSWDQRSHLATKRYQTPHPTSRNQKQDEREWVAASFRSDGVFHLNGDSDNERRSDAMKPRRLKLNPKS